MKKKKKAKGGYIPLISGIGVYKKSVKAIGLFFFLVGAVLIITAYFKVPIKGYVIAPPFAGTMSFAGLFLEIIGVILMAVRVKEKEIKG